MSGASGMGLLLCIGLALGATAEENAKVRAKAKTIEWPVLSEMDYETGKMPKTLTQALRKPVKIRGYAMPLEASGDGVRSFVLVSDPMFCAHVPPPPPNQLIMVDLDKALPWQVFEKSLWL
ncbi:MAG: DUF3299 domain-containing protein, partial [Myxococcota bacterium]